jgi:hypothetical protein
LKCYSAQKPDPKRLFQQAGRFCDNAFSAEIGKYRKEVHWL